MSVQHSPAPWTKGMDFNDQSLILAANSRFVATCHHECIDEDGMKANANLICAAPDLLAACKALLVHHTTSPTFDATCPCVAKAQAAIAKAVPQ